MGSTSYLGKPKSAGYRAKSGSSAGSDKEMNGKLRRPKIRRPTKLSDYGLKRIPDYTELAYKEAVSKLRYFLSGNYAPSVRTYGSSPSIKNLDESDGDADKKYLSPSYALLDYKPRPRLTAKYATLYADSLNNTYGQRPATLPPAPIPARPPAQPSDQSGSANPDVVAFIQKQDEYIEQLERESKYCRDELNNLLGKVKEVISENEHLHEAQKNKLISRMFHSYGSETDDLDDLGDSTGLDSDNKVSPSKSRKSKSRSSRLEGPNIVFESRISELEAQLAQANIDLKKLQDENNENKRKLASGLVDSTCLDGLRRQIDNLQRDKTSLESQISKLKLSLEQRDEDGKYRRPDIVEQQLRDERNNLEAEIRRLKEELSKERTKIRELAGEGARRAIQERSAAEQRYNAHFDELQHDLAVQYDTVAKLQLELERQRREENDLKRELSMKNSAIEELKMELKNKTSTLLADLSQAHAEKASLEEELASARLTIERQQRQAKHEANRLNSEIQSLRQRLDRADADLVHSRRENLRLSEQISALEKELNMKNLTPISPEKKKDNQLSAALENIENKHAKTVAELETMIQSQNSLMEKLTGECRLLTDKLDDANRRHKQELGTLQRQVETLRQSLPQQAAMTPSTYQAQPTHTSSTNRNGPAFSPDTRPDNTRVDPTRYTTDPTVTDLRNDPSRSSRSSSRQLSRQSSKVSIKPDDTSNVSNNFNLSDNTVEIPQDETVMKEDLEKLVAEKPLETSEYNPHENYESHAQDYEQPAQNYEQPAQNYEQTAQNFDKAAADGQYADTTHYATQGADYEQADQSYDQSQANYQNQGFEQNYEQVPESTYENYEQYPQQYTDPNAQYEGQYENYGTENYQGEQNYDNTQYNQEYTPEYQQNDGVTVQQQNESSPSVSETKVDPQTTVSQDKPPATVADTKRNNLPAAKLTKS